MSTNDEEDFLEEGEALVRRFLHRLNRSGRVDIESVLALARLVYWASVPDLDGETAEMTEALLLMRDGAKKFERAVEEAWVAEVKNERAGAECAAQATA